MTLRVHLDGDNCMEVTAFNGTGAEVQHFADHIIAERGVRYGRLVMMPTEVGKKTASMRKINQPPALKRHQFDARRLPGDYEASGVHHADHPSPPTCFRRICRTTDQIVNAAIGTKAAMIKFGSVASRPVSCAALTRYPNSPTT
jgi:hypothetical protein